MMRMIARVQNEKLGSPQTTEVREQDGRQDYKVNTAYGHLEIQLRNDGSTGTDHAATRTCWSP